MRLDDFFHCYDQAICIINHAIRARIDALDVCNCIELPFSLYGGPKRAK